jgi:hypothetical protein
MQAHRDGREGTVFEHRVQGPAEFLVDHPSLYALSLLGAAGATAALAARAARADGLRRLGWSALAVLELGITLGILDLRRRRPRR